MATTLADVPLLAGLDEATLDDLAKVLEEKQLGDGQLICEEGSAGDEFYLITAGQATVSKIIDRDEAREKVLATLQTGDFFGEMALLEDAPRSANVRAVGPTTVLVLSRANFRALLDRASDAAMRLLFGIIKTIITRLRGSSTELVALYDTGKVVGSVTDLATLAAKILERLLETIRMRRGIVLLKNPYSGVLEVQEIVGYEPGAAMKFNLVTGEGLLAELFDNRRPFLFNNFKAGADQPLHGFERPRMLGAPLVAGERVIGAIILAEPTGPATLDMNHLNLFLGVAAQVATAMENARLRQEEEAKKLHDRHFVTF